MVAPRGVCVVAPGGACMVAPGGCAWFYLGGHVWFYLGDVHGFIRGGMCGFIWGVCMVLFWGMISVNKPSGLSHTKGVKNMSLFSSWKVLLNTSSILLPPTNEVWGKVIFLHQFVILFTGGACMVAPGGHAWLLWGGMHGFIWGVCMVLFGGGMHGFIQGACVVLFGGHTWFYSGGPAWFYSGGACVVFSVFSDTMRYGQWVGGTHPTGMHSF